MPLLTLRSTLQTWNRNADESPSGSRRSPSSANRMLPPGAFYGEMLKRLLESLAAPAGAIWVRTAQGHLQLQYQINLKEIGLEQSEEARKSHEELLRQAMQQPRPFHVPPRSGVGVTRGGQARRRQPHRSFAASRADRRQSAARRHHRSLAARQPPAAGHHRLPAIHDLHGRVVPRAISATRSWDSSPASSRCGRNWKRSPARFTPASIRPKSPIRWPTRAGA